MKTLLKKFHALLNEMSIMDRKADILFGYGIESSKELTKPQLEGIISGLERDKYDLRDRALKVKRSEILRLLTSIGVYYLVDGESKHACWTRIDTWLEQPTIASKPLYKLSIPEMDALYKKIKALQIKGYNYRKNKDSPKPTQNYTIAVNNTKTPS